jgi:hypothetical protein
MHARRTIALLFLAALAACRTVAGPAGEQAARGAVSVVEERVPEGELGRQLARNTAIGLVETLSEPEQLRRLRVVMRTVGAGVLEGAASPRDEPLACMDAPWAQRLSFMAPARQRAAGSEEAPFETLAEQAAEAFVDTFTRRLIAQLGRGGQGPLSDSMAATGERLSGSAVKGMRAEFGNLFPECRGSDRPQCIERRLEALGRAASSGISQGLTQSLANKDQTAVSPLAEALVASFSKELIAQLGPDGEGPLARSLAAVSEKLAASVVRGVRAEIAPECEGDDSSRCLDRRIQALGKATSAGLSAGASPTFGPYPIVIGFIAGLLSAGAIAAIALRVGTHRSSSQPS